MDILHHDLEAIEATRLRGSVKRQREPAGLSGESGEVDTLGGG
jgi:hypothetical protein